MSKLDTLSGAACLHVLVLDLQRSGIATKSADELLVRMQAKVDGLCEERDRLVGGQRRKYPGTDKVINGPIERRFR